MIKSKIFLQVVFIRVVLCICMIMLMSYSAFANDISVKNVSLTLNSTTDNYMMVKFDISWENSWRTSSSPNNWDAAWVFVKYRVGSGEWQHAWLDNTGHVNLPGSTISTGLLDPALPFDATDNPGMGAFIYRSANGTGTFSNTGVQLRWNSTANGVNDNANIDIRVFAIEMVYVPQGSFFAGSGGTEDDAFYKYPNTTNPFKITSEGAITVGTSNNNLYYKKTSKWSGDQSGPIPSTFPKGYNAFYCMKCEISQQGYVDFLNNITQSQAVNRYSVESTGCRYGISVSRGVYTTVNPYVACNYLCWADMAAYLDWSGLRPMTELEFEKSCRGTQTAVPNEYAWGTTGIASNQYSLSNSGASNEKISSNYSTSLGNAAYIETTPVNGNINGPVRGGIFAGNGSNTGRVTAGATYYGIMEMSGNLWERTVTVGNSAGRVFTGSNGNGLLSLTGDADASTWPGIDALGAGFRGAAWGNFVATYLQVSYRYAAAITDNNRGHTSGGRGVRAAP